MALAAICLPGSALAAGEDDANPDQIVVTGTRIAGDAAEVVEPLETIDSSVMKDRALGNVADVLDSWPTFAPPASSRVGEQSGSFGAGQYFVDLFGLGSQRTLVLVDGKRFVSGNTATIFGPAAPGSQVDINTVPSLLLDRVEILPVGGAPVYGSDAIAGTVNIVLRNRFEGVELTGQAGLADHGDAAEYRLGAIVGTSFANDRGSAILAAEYHETNGLLDIDRPRTARGLYFASPYSGDYPYSNELIEDRRIAMLSEYGVPLVADFIPAYGREVANAEGQALRFDADGNLVPIDFGSPTGSIVNASGGNQLSLTPYRNLLSPTERFNAMGRLKYDLSDGLSFYADLAFSRSKAIELRAQPTYNTYLFGSAGSVRGNLIVPLDNPFLDEAARAVIADNLDFDRDGFPDQDYFYVARANTDIASGRASSRARMFQANAGFEGTFEAGNNQYRWHLGGSFGRSTTRGEIRQLVRQNFLNALEGCLPGYENAAVASVSADCVAFNPFGNQNDQAAIDYVTALATPVSVNELVDISGSLTGSPFALPAGDAEFVLGFEHRREESDFDPGEYFYGYADPLASNGGRLSFGSSVPIDPVTGQFHTTDLFGEVRLPLVSPAMDVPGVYLLEAHGSARHVDHSLAGGSWVWSARTRWQPVEAITLRGSITHSIRAPAITEMFNPASEILTKATDPCDARYLTSGPNPDARQANCAASGLAEDFVSNISNFTVPGTLSGNRDLRNERAHSWTAGISFAPSSVPALRASLDWVDIDLQDAIISANATQTLVACYDTNDFPSVACDRFVRESDGQISFIQTGYLNASSFHYAGLVGQVAYSFATPGLGLDSRIRLQTAQHYTHRLEQRIGLGDLTIFQGAAGYSKYRANADAAYESGPFDLHLQAQYIGSAKVDPNAATDAYDYSRFDDAIFINMAVVYAIRDGVGLRFAVDNLFDTGAPMPSPLGDSTSTYFSGILGRYFRIAATARF